MPPVASIILLSYNNGPYVKEAIESSVNQTFQEEYEIIMVDDGSTDNSVEIAKEYSRIRDIYVMPENTKSWASIPLNYAIERAKGELIVILSTDDFFHKDYLTHMVSEFRRCQTPKTIKYKGETLGRVGSGKLGIVRTGMMEFNVEFKRSSRRFPLPALNPKRDILIKNIIYGSALFSKKAWEDVGGFDNLILQDWDFWIRVLWKGYELATWVEVEFAHRTHKSALSYSARHNGELSKMEEEFLNKMALKHKALIEQEGIIVGELYDSLSGKVWQLP